MKHHIVFVGMYGVPFLRRAMDVRLAYFANLLSDNYKITIVNRHSLMDYATKCDIELSESIEILELSRIESQIKGLNVLLYLLSVIKEPFALFWLNRKEKIDVIHVSSWHFLDFLFYKLLSFFLNSKVVVQYVEYASSKPRRNIYSTINGYISDIWGPKFWDGAICISDYLETHVVTNFSKVKTIKIIPLCDFDFFANIKEIEGIPPYLLFCGSSAYSEIIEFIIHSYQKSKISISHKLILVLSGSEEKLEYFRNIDPNILLYSNLKYEVLVSYYKSASALLIPLRPNIEDIARFPNKICEYLASRGLIITTANGEILNYFNDEKDSLIAKSYSVDDYSGKLDWLDDNKDLIPILKEKAYSLGKEYFNSNSYDTEIIAFFEQMIND